MKNAVLAVLLLIGIQTIGQKLEEETTILDAKRGAPAFQLQKGERLYSFEPDAAGWYKVRKKAYAPMGTASEGVLLAGTKLSNKENEPIGETLAELKLVAVDTVEGFRSEDRLAVVLEGYVFKTKWANNSIPEKEVTQLLAIRNRTEQQEAFAQLWRAYDAEERDFEEFTAHVIRKQNASLTEPDDFRLIVVFRDGTSAFCVITNDHTVEVPKLKDSWEDGDFKISYLYKPSSAQRELMERILFTYLAL